MKKYCQFNKRQFEYRVREILIKNRLGFLKDITDSYIADGGTTWERIYAVSTANKSVEIFIFSSIDLRTDSVRNKGSDAVRIVLRWKTKNGYVYKKVAKHLRINTLFENIKKSLINCNRQIFNLNYKEFSKKIS